MYFWDKNSSIFSHFSLIFSKQKHNFGRKIAQGDKTGSLFILCLIIVFGYIFSQYPVNCDLNADVIRLHIDYIKKQLNVNSL
jgi:hypothetical protein